MYCKSNHRSTPHGTGKNELELMTMILTSKKVQVHAIAEDQRTALHWTAQAVLV